MIKKTKRYKHKKKNIDKKQEKEIRKLARKKVVKERVSVNKKIVEIVRPLFFIEAKEMYFKQQEE